jgi:hypothetical protein
MLPSFEATTASVVPLMGAANPSHGGSFAAEFSASTAIFSGCRFSDFDLTVSIRPESAQNGAPGRAQLLRPDSTRRGYD